MSKKRSKSSPSKTKPRGGLSAGQRGKDGASSSDKRAREPFLSAAGVREVVESVVIAFVLAFLFRTFEAEAFVIPTGSMAPTLMGRHKDLACPECGHRFQVSASDEMNNTTGQLTGDKVVACTCPVCRYTIQLGSYNPRRQKHPSYKGDRILVAKFPYQFGDPERWDVAVFKFPGGAKTNFIKRIVGLPNETIVISHGDLFVRPAEEEDFIRFGNPPRYAEAPSVSWEELEREFRIARKPPSKVRAMLQLVYDNDRVQPKLIETGWLARWSPMGRQDGVGGWRTSEDYRSFSTDGSAERDAWVAYRHVVPSFEDWQFLEEGSMPPDKREPLAQLITDFSAYNTDVLRPGGYVYRAQGGWQGGYQASAGGFDAGDGPAPSAEKLGLHWAGDLAVECTLEVESQEGEAILELVEGGRLFRCRLDVATGQAALSIDQLDQFRPTAQTRVRGPGTYRVMFSNVDDQLLLWVNGRVVRFDTETTYPPLGNIKPTPEDLIPVRIGCRRHAALRVSQLKVYRDIYYIAERSSRGGYYVSHRPYGGISANAITDFVSLPYRSGTREDLARVLSHPEDWDAFGTTRRVAFPLRGDQFLVLGDNSAESKDSRLWENENFAYYVSRELLIGKALVIYWPHGWDIPGTSLPIKVVPNIWRILRFVR